MKKSYSYLSFLLLIFSAICGNAIQCLSLFPENRLNQIRSFNRTKIEYRNNEFSFLKDRIGTDSIVLVYESDAKLSEQLRKYKIEGYEVRAGGVPYIKVNELIDGVWTLKTVPFARIRVLGEDSNQNMKLTSISPSTAKRKIQRFANIWQENFKVFEQAFKEGLTVEVSNDTLTQIPVLTARVNAIDIDPSGTALIRLININGTSVSQTISLTSFRVVRIVGSKTIPIEGKDISGLFKQNPNQIDSLDRTELAEMEYMTSERVAGLSTLDQALLKKLPIRWTENGKPLIGRVSRLFIDKSTMVIAEIKDLSSDKTIYRTLLGLNEVQIVPNASAIKNQDRTPFEKADEVFFEVANDFYKDNEPHVRQWMDHWKSALISGATVEWQNRGGWQISGRIEQIYSDASGEVLVVIRMGEDSFISTFHGFFYNNGLATSLFKSKSFPTVVEPENQAFYFDSRLRLTTKAEKELSNSKTETVDTLKRALLENRKIDFRFSQTGSGEEVANYTRAEVLGLEGTDISNIFAVIKVDGKKTAQLINWLSIRDVRISAGGPLPIVPKPLPNLMIARPGSEKIELTLEQRRTLTNEDIALLRILEKAIESNIKIVYATWDGTPVLAEVVRLHSLRFSTGNVLTATVKTHTGKVEVISATLLRGLELKQ